MDEKEKLQNELENLKKEEEVLELKEKVEKKKKEIKKKNSKLISWLKKTKKYMEDINKKYRWENGTKRI